MPSTSYIRVNDSLNNDCATLPNLKQPPQSNCAGHQWTFFNLSLFKPLTHSVK